MPIRHASPRTLTEAAKRQATRSPAERAAGSRSAPVPSHRPSVALLPRGVDHGPTYRAICRACGDYQAVYGVGGVPRNWRRLPNGALQCARCARG